MKKLLGILQFLWDKIKTLFASTAGEKSDEKTSQELSHETESQPVTLSAANVIPQAPVSPKIAVNSPEDILTPVKPESPVNIPKKREFNRNSIISDDDFLITPADFDIQKFLEKYNSFLAIYKVNGLYTENPIRLVSEIIKEASQYVSARLILATLQKEQNLITRNAIPSQNVIDWAMGFGAGDGGDLQVHFKGLENQIIKAAQRMRHIFDESAEQFIDKDISKQFLNKWAVVRDGIVLPANKATVVLYAYTPFIGERNFLVSGKNSKFTMYAPFGNKYFYDVWNYFFA